MKEFKKCPRCNNKVPTDFARCGNCGLNFMKFDSATNKEAKSAFRMGEKERILTTRHIPSDVNKFSTLMQCIFGGWFGLHYFAVGRLWRALYQLISFLLGMVYCFVVIKFNIYSGWLYNILLIGGIAWAISVIIWMWDILSILFKRY